MGEVTGKPEEIRHALGERIKELRALHAVAHLILRDDITADEQHHAVVALLPPAMQFPEIATACIHVGDARFPTANHAPTPWLLSSAFTTAAGVRGHIEVAYHEHRTENPFLVEEQALLDSIAEMLRTAIDRRDAHDSLRALNERLGLALTAAEMGVWEWNIKTNMVTWSEHLAQMTGITSKGDPFGTHRDLLHPDDRAYVYSRLERAVIGEDDLKDLTFRFRRPEGGWRHMIGRARITRDDAANTRATRILAALIDVSERRLLEESLRQSQKLEALGQIAGGVAHDFNNLLAILLCNAELLRNDLPPDHPWRETVDELYATSQRGKELTKQLLTFSRTASFSPVAVDINALLDRLKPLLIRIAQRTVKLQLDLTPNASSIFADPVQIEQLVMNLVVNARDAMPNGGTLLVRTSHATRTSTTGAAVTYVCIEVQDSGTGIPDAVKARLFEPFFTTKEPGKGTGLGLAVVSSVARQWQGLIEVDGVLNEGTTFRALFPLLP